MYRTGPPASVDGHAQLRASGHQASGLGVSGAWRREFDGTSQSARDPAFRAYLADLVRPYGLGLREDLLGQGSGQSYTEMAGALLADMTPEQPVDLLVLAFAVSDTLPGLSSASYLSHLCPGNPLAFAICDQGSAAPFTGLRLISEYARTGGCMHALLVVVEQAALHYDLAAPAALPARNAAVALRCGQAGPGRLGQVRMHAGLEPAAVSGLLAAGLAELSGGRDDIAVIMGAGFASLDASLAASPAIGEVLDAPAGQPCTGVWWELAGRLPEWTAAGRRVVLADYDPLLGSLCLSAIDIEAGPASASAASASAASASEASASEAGT